MNITTSGIVIHSTKYANTSLIVKIFTEAQGTQSFIIKGAFGKKSRMRASLFTPMALVNITYNDHAGDRLKFLKEVSRTDSAANITFDPVKSALLLFYNELIYKILYDAGPDTVLFHFLESEVMKIGYFDQCPADLPLRFLIRLSIILGFLPENNYSSENPYFSLADCRFQPHCFDERNDVPAAESQYLSMLLKDDECPIPSRQIRNNLLHYLIEYFKLHNEQLKELESVDILSIVLHS